MESPNEAFGDIDLNDKFDLEKDRVFISGTQALVRLCLIQAARDRAAGLDTAGYVSGYRGSPLGGLDQQFSRGAKHLAKAQVRFEPALNEDLAATAICGTQQAELRGDGKHDGVFAMWYGKGPGVDRSGDAFRHGNLAGTSPHGGVLVLMGDDHTCESSTTAHQSEFALVDAMIPVLNPASISELVEYGLQGWALSRYAGVWCGLKCVKDNVESTGSVNLSPKRFETRQPQDDLRPQGGLNIRRNDPPLDQEARLHRHKLNAVHAFARANSLDRIIRSGGQTPRIGIVSTGKSYLDTLEALELLGLDEATCNAQGVSLYKVGMSWPLEPQGISTFSKGLDLVVVVEEKRGLIEDQVRNLLYSTPNAPAVIGKRNEVGAVLFQAEGALNPVQIAQALGARIFDTGHPACSALDGLGGEADANIPARTAYFCAGCPHNSSTKIPEGTRAYAGIGCHYLVQAMDRNTDGFTQMGGEGANWIGEAFFSTRDHVFQNIGDGTFNHSGLMAIRAAIDSGVNITFKVLYNDAVAMTGGQAHDGGMDLYQIAHEVTAAGAVELVVVSDRPELIEKPRLPGSPRIYPRSELLTVQERLSKIEGCTILIYEQTCAAEKRRRRKRGKMEDPPKRAFINSRVCEGCGDCGVQSNCVAITPQDTPWGRKRRIDQSSCNKDYSCVNGFCPSFVTVESAIRKPDVTTPEAGDIPEPASTPSLANAPYSVVLTGVGGTGVVTIGALMGMAAHLEGKGCGIVDMAGMAQKGGAVTSHIRIGQTPDEIGVIRVAPGGADLLLGCDLVVSASDSVQAVVRKGRTRALVNTAQVMTGAFTRDADFRLPVNLMEQRLTRNMAEGDAHLVNATRMAEQLLGDSIGANLFMLGAAYQLGHVPLSSGAILHAIAMNGVAIEFNTNAFSLGRAWAHDPARIEAIATPKDNAQSETLDQMITRCTDELTAYQSHRYARRYETLAKAAKTADSDPNQRFARAVAQNAYKLMAYKDEYEVARLYSDPAFHDSLSAQFEDPKAIKIHLAPPGLTRTDPATGRPRKKAFGPWVLKLMRVLRHGKRLRGSPFDLFGYTAERKGERALATDYLAEMHALISDLSQDTYERALERAELPEIIRGFGPVKAASIAEYHARRVEPKMGSADKIAAQ